MVRKLFLIVIIIFSALLVIGSDARPPQLVIGSGAQPAQLVRGLPESQDVRAIVTDGERREFSDVVPGGVPTVVFTVPKDETFVLTDALFSKGRLGGTKTLVATIYRSTGSKTCDPNGPGFKGDDLFTAFVKPDENVVFHFKTGYEFRAGERMCYLGTISGIETRINFSLLGDLKPVISEVPVEPEVSAQPSVSAQDRFEKGWQISTFASVDFEDEVWMLVEENGVCNTYSSEPRGINDPASVSVSHLGVVTTLSYANVGARVKVCNTVVFLPATGTGTRIQEDE